MSSAPREPSHEEASSERWLVSYADFITLMFAFFAILYATSEKDLEKSKEFQESIKKYLIKAGAFGESGGQVQQGEKGNATIEPPIPTYKESRPETAALLDKAEAYLELKLSKDERKKYILDITTDEWGVRLILPASGLYANGSDRFQPEAMPFIKKLSGLLAESSRKILIEGHVSKGEVGNTRSTWDFASARAINLLRFMQKSQNIAPERLATASLADSRPMFSENQDVKNSRIELILLNQDIEW